MSVPISVVDAFTDTAFRGNPAAVCQLETPAPDDWMQSVAAEMNLAETAFVVPRDAGEWDLRWFTPTVEVDLCGHATLASTHVLGQAAHFHTRSGVLSCAPTAGGWIEMDFPVLAPKAAAADAGLLRALGTPDVYAVATSRFDILVELGSAEAVRALEPDLGALRTLSARGVIVTAPGDTEGVDMVSRFFAPGAGVDEDPVTGSAHCVLAPFWAARTGRAALVGYQASARGGMVRVGVRGDRVLLGGKAVTVISGYLEREG